MRLPQEEIKKRLTKLRNLERLHLDQRFKIWHLRDENRALKKEVASLKLVAAEQQKTINDMKLQIEELRTMVFGKKKPPKQRDDSDNFNPPTEKIQRTPDSYKRPTPGDEHVTEIKPHTMSLCACGCELTKKQEVIFFEEDIPIPAKKIVRKHVVEKGWCPDCQTWQTAMALPPSKVILGSNVRKYVCYLSVLCRLSFSQIQNLLHDTYHITISQGEITNILGQEAQKLRPFYERLKEKIRGEPCVHLDETSWKLFIDPDKNFAWIMSGSESKESVFLIGENRGGGNVETLIGNDYNGVVITDDYGAYKKLANHQLCWAHLLRKFRDLARSAELEECQHQHCRQEYETICRIYDDVKNNRRIERYDEFARRLHDISQLHPDDPRKLIKTKTTLKKNIPNYLVCLANPTTPMTNNQAERSLRHLVLKRKISFGSLTKKTAENLAVLLSVLMSLKQRHQGNFFLEYLRA